MSKKRRKINKIANYQNIIVGNQDASQFDVSSVNGAQQNVPLLTSPFLVARLCSISRLLRFSAGFTSVRSLAVAAFDLVYCSQLSFLRFVSVLDISKQSP